jgi:hypothetical protein
MATYSFLDVQAAIVGPGGAIQLGNGAGTAEEGISYSMEGDKDTLTIGADGTPMHVLNASKGGEVIVRMLKTSPANFQLAIMYNAQTVSSALHGNNLITIRDKARGDVVTCRSCAFRRMPPNSWAKGGNTIEWAFTAGYIDVLFGSGTPEVLNA